MVLELVARAPFEPLVRELVGRLAFGGAGSLDPDADGRWCFLRQNVVGHGSPVAPGFVVSLNLHDHILWLPRPEEAEYFGIRVSQRSVRAALKLMRFRNAAALARHFGVWGVHEPRSVVAVLRPYKVRLDAATGALHRG